MDNISESSNVPSSVNSNLQESEMSMGNNNDTNSNKSGLNQNYNQNDNLNAKIMELIQSGEIHKYPKLLEELSKVLPVVNNNKNDSVNNNVKQSSSNFNSE